MYLVRLCHGEIAREARKSNDAEETFPSFSPPSVNHLSLHIFFRFFPLLFSFFYLLSSSFLHSLQTLSPSFPSPSFPFSSQPKLSHYYNKQSNGDRIQSLAFKGGQHPRLRDPALWKPLLDIWWRPRPRLALQFQTPVVHHPSPLHFLHLDIDPFPSGRNGRVPVVYGQDLSSSGVAFCDGLGV